MDTTNINDLPIDTIGGGSNNPISMSAAETAQGPAGGGENTDQNTIQQIISGIKQASTSGITQLPSRDIPMATDNIMRDPQTLPNYVPEYREDYIRRNEQLSEMTHAYNKNMQYQNALDDTYNEFQTPLLLMIMYFLFQLPIVKKMLYSYLPMLCANDGNYNLNGLVFTSLSFGAIYYVLLKTTTLFS